MMALHAKILAEQRPRVSLESYLVLDLAQGSRCKEFKGGDIRCMARARGIGQHHDGLPSCQSPPRPSFAPCMLTKARLTLIIAAHQTNKASEPPPAGVGLPAITCTRVTGNGAKTSHAPSAALAVVLIPRTAIAPFSRYPASTMAQIAFLRHDW